MKRRILFLIGILTCLFNLYSQINLYSGADSSTQLKLKKSDELILNKKYESAFNSLGQDNSNEYIIAKKTEICLNYFVQSLMHQMFAFKDISQNEDLYQLRNDKGTFNMIKFDPVKIINDYDKKNKIPILNKALGDYYYDINLRYNGRWIISDDEVQKNSIKYYQLAYNSNCFTAESLANFGEICLSQGNNNQSIELYSKAIQLNNSQTNYHYNLAIAYKNIGNYELSLKEAEIAFIGYSNNVEYQIDSLLVCADSSFLNKQVQESIKYLIKGIQISNNDYRLYKKLNELYLSINDIKNANINADKLFSMFPTNPGATQIILQNYLNANKQKELIDFYNRNIKIYQNQYEVLGNLYFHFASFYYNENNHELAANYAEKSRDNFIKADMYSDELKNEINKLISE